MNLAQDQRLQARYLVYITERVNKDLKNLNGRGDQVSSQAVAPRDVISMSGLSRNI
jgi:hypothetical protein